MDIYTPFTSIWPLCFILLVSLLKDGYEDYRRYASDKVTNTKPVKIFRENRFALFKSEDIQVGDFIFVKAFNNCFYL
jgi:magnesium-transporting ATPase (P-type)